MDPFGNFGWSFGFGFGWILIGVVAILMIAAIWRLVDTSFKFRRMNAEEETRLRALKDKVCENKISFQQFEEELKSMS